MNTELISKCDLFVSNYREIMKTFSFENSDMAMAGSSFYVGMNREADIDQMKACAQILKENSGALSDYRGDLKMPLVCKMAVAEDPEQYLMQIQSLAKQMKDPIGIDRVFKILAAMTICDHAEPENYQQVASKMMTLYQGMKKNHPWITEGEDVPFAAMLAVSDLDAEDLLAEMERCFPVLQEHFHDKNSVQSLSHVLALDKKETNEKCQKVIQIWDQLKARKHRYGVEYELAVLGTLALLEMPVETIVDEIIEADDYLAQQKGFGGLAMGEQRRRMYAALMVMDTHMPPADSSHESLVDSMMAMLIALQICMILLMISTTTMMTTMHH